MLTSELPPDALPTRRHYPTGFPFSSARQPCLGRETRLVSSHSRCVLTSMNPHLPNPRRRQRKASQLTSQHLIQSRLARPIGAKPILMIPKSRCRAGIGRDKDQLGRRRLTADLQELLGDDDGPDGVGMQMHRKVTEGSGKQVSERSRGRPTSRRKEMCIHLCSSLDQFVSLRPMSGEAMCATTHIWIFQNTCIQHYVVNLETSIDQFFDSGHECLKPED